MKLRVTHKTKGVSVEEITTLDQFLRDYGARLTVSQAEVIDESLHDTGVYVTSIEDGSTMTITVLGE